MIPYAMLVAGACVVGYLVAGFTTNVVLTFVIAIIALFIFIFITKYFYNFKAKKD